MADIPFTIGKGRVVELYRRVLAGDPSTAALVVFALKASGLQAQSTMRAHETMAAVLSANDEADGSGYARLVLVDTDLTALTPDHANARFPLSLPTLAFGPIGASDDWGRIVVAYAPDSGGSTSTFIPLTMHDVEINPDGTAVNIPIGTGGVFFRAS